MRGVEIHQQLQHLVVHPQRLSVGPVDLVDQHDGLEPERQRLARDEPRLGHRTFGGIHEQQEAVHHPQDALDFSAEIGVARRIYNIDFGIGPPNRSILRQDRNSALTLQRVRVHDALGHLLIGTEHPRLAEHLVHQRGFPMIDVGNDGDVADFHCFTAPLMRGAV